MSCDGVQCSGPRGKQAKSYPLSDIISFSPPLPSSLSSLLSPVPSNPSKFPHPTHPALLLRLPRLIPVTLKSALSAAAAFSPATASATHLADPPFIRTHPTHGVSPSPPSYPAPTPSRPHHQPFPHRSSSESPRRARSMLALSHFFRSLSVGLEFPPRARPRFPPYTV